VADIDPIARVSSITGVPGRRVSKRDSLLLSATIRRSGDAEEGLLPVRVRNLSSVGLMADYGDVADAGEAVQVTMRGIGTVSGKVAWIKDGRIGVAFDKEVDPQLARKPVAPAPRPVSKPIRPIF